ncbi:AraC family transcriptional regulator [Cystobacter ferrugineus]|uniref:AraC family transcriptional regulator n=1 Tax=Cystobacter ferrugineus TaxID=83449 RepID=A0A1L9AVE2_9BACT|nr:AraC family transcriptional regulator [Cystobacter ferrugineus]
MSGQRLGETLVERRPRIELGVELRATSVGEVRHLLPSAHSIIVHAGEPVRTSCHSNRMRSIRTRGDIFFIPAGVLDEWVDDDASSSVELRLPAALLRRVAEDMGLDPDRIGLEPRHQFREAQIEHLAWALEAECRAGFPNGLLYSESLGLALAAHLLTRYRAPVEARGGLSKRQLQRVIEYIEAHLDQNLSLTRLASVAEASTSHFKVLFKRSMGLPVHEYVMHRRVERARSLLVHGELPASEVALEAGFSHQSHMARWMRRVLGVTPTSVVRRRNHVTS